MLIKGTRCPRCSEPIEYNGTYFCSSCSWVLPEFAKGKDLEAFKIAYVLYMKQTNREDKINTSYL